MRSTTRFLYLLLLVVLIVLLYNLNDWTIREGFEAQLAEISREMLRSGDYLHPRLLSIDHYQHPPMVYWLSSLGMLLWGVNPFGARFFAQIALLSQVALIYHISLRLMGSQRIALFSGLIYLSLPLVLFSSRILTPDLFLVTFELVAMSCLLIYHLERKRWALYGLGLSLGLGCLTDGFRIFLMPLLLALYVLIFAPRRGYAIHWRHVALATLLGALIGSSWYLYLAYQHPTFWHYVSQQYILDKFFSSTQSRQSWWRFTLALSIGSLPWLVVFIGSWFNPKIALWQNNLIAQLSCFLFILPGLFIILTGSGTPISLLSVLAGLAILLGYQSQLLSPLALRWHSLFCLQLYWVIGILAFGVPLFSQLFGEKLGISWAMAITSLGILVLVTLLFGLMRAGIRFRLVMMALVSSLMLLLYSGYFSAANPVLSDSTAPLAYFIKTQKLHNYPILVYNETLPSLAFQLDRDIITISHGKAAPNLQFQTRIKWRDHWIMPDYPGSARYLRQLITQPSVLIVSGDLPERWNWIGQSYSKAKSISRWQVFYRP
jgi:4-amino-4-deoxy-L-arabinose transferase-like glycosyltransferase